MMGLRLAKTKTVLLTKKLGADETREQPVGAKCRAERNGGCLGEFLVWFPNRTPGSYYTTVDASKLHEVLEFVDGRRTL